MKQLLIDVKNLFLDTFFPVTCLLCDRGDTFLCSSCKKSLTRVGEQRCVVCQKPSLQGLTHSKCEAPQAPDVLWSLYDYHDPRVAQLIVNAKYHFLPGVFGELGSTLGPEIKKYFPAIDNQTLVVPIPLKASRKRWRGFNQAELIAETLAQSIGAKTDEALIRVKTTKVQKDLGKEERKLNVKDAFALAGTRKTFKDRLMGLLFEKSDRHQVPDINNKTIILIDDVVTTGSTLIEAAKILKRNGAGIVYCMTIAQD